MKKVTITTTLELEESGSAAERKAQAIRKQVHAVAATKIGLSPETRSKRVQTKVA